MDQFWLIDETSVLQNWMVTLWCRWEYSIPQSQSSGSWCYTTHVIKYFLYLQISSESWRTGSPAEGKEVSYLDVWSSEHERLQRREYLWIVKKKHLYKRLTINCLNKHHPWDICCDCYFIYNQTKNWFCVPELHNLRNAFRLQLLSYSSHRFVDLRFYATGFAWTATTKLQILFIDLFERTHFEIFIFILQKGI